MNKKILYLAVAVVIVLFGASSVSGIVTQPPPGVKDPNLKSIWAVVMDLQKQVSGKSKVVIVKGEASAGAFIAAPSPYTIDQCKIIVSPQRFECPMSPSKSYLNSFQVYPQTAGTDHWSILVIGLCVRDDGTTIVPVTAQASYLIICS